MKRLFTIMAAVLITAAISAQSPQKMSYQAVIRNSNKQLVTNQAVGMRVSILQGSATGIEVYKEIYNPNPQTNANGLVTLEIGGGIPLTGTFNSINWSSGTYFINIETDPTGGTNYTITGTSQLLSVPYALHAQTAASYPETDPLFGSSSASGITGTNIANWNTAYGWGNHTSAGYLLNTRTLTINGTTFDLMANRSWSVGTVTSVGLSLPNIFSLSGSPITTTGTLTVALASQTASTFFASPGGSSGTPAFRPLVATDIPNLDWSKITSGKPTTLGGYGITDAVNTTGNQTIAGNKTFTGTTTVSTPVNGSDAATKAYVDALQQTINELESQPGIAKDVDGNLYTTIKIGTQVWMAENLKTTRYKDGTDIVLITDAGGWSFGGIPGYCWYDNNEASYKNTHGALYNWYSVNTGLLCPAGWHVPADDELTKLENYLIANGYNYDGTTSGNKIAKSLASTTLWQSTTTAGAVGNTDYPDKRNAIGFTALPSGYRLYNGTYTAVGSLFSLWSSTEYSTSTAWYRSMSCWDADVDSSSFDKRNGHSVRCLRD